MVPAWKRPEYFEKCKQSLMEAQEYPEGTEFFFPEKNSLRTAIIDFFEETRDRFDILAKMDNDCTVPKNWLNDLLKIFEDYPDVGILSPNVFPSDAASKYGESVPGLPYRPTKLIGGLWTMRASLVRGMTFYDYGTKGLVGAHAILRQIIGERSPKIGWVDSVVVQDMGHWSGHHPEHIKSEEHFDYSQEVGRPVAWSPEPEKAVV